MDVEHIQKINNLALQLMKQGLAKSRDEAINQADNFLRKGETEGFGEIRQTLNKVETAKIHSQTEEKTSLSQDQIQDILEKNTKFLVKTIKEFQEKITSLENELGQLRNKINYHGLPTVNDVVSKRRYTEENQPRIENASEVPPVVDEQAAGQRKQAATKEKHPRYGDYKESDVSIEKFFYMGSK